MLKVGSPQPQGGQEMLPNPDMGAMPPMDEPPMNDGGMMDGNMEPPMAGPDGMDNQFDNDFDAGVDADEEKDPRRYIEQLAGKLSQKLSEYNKNQQQPDTELCKFVCGMINAQATKGLSQEDVDEILKKIESDEEFEEPQEDGEPHPENEVPEQSPNMPMESVCRNKVNEIFQELTEPECVDNNIEKKRTDTSNSFRKKPFVSPSFK